MFLSNFESCEQLNRVGDVHSLLRIAAGALLPSKGSDLSSEQFLVFQK